MEDDILKMMDLLITTKKKPIKELEELKKQIANLIQANVDLMDELKQSKHDSYILCKYIKDNVRKIDDYIYLLMTCYEKDVYEGGE